MKKNNQKGFSLIELLLVVVIIGIVSAIAIPNLLRSRVAAENASAISNLRQMLSEQVSFYARNSRYARLDELNAQTNNSLGTYTAPTLVRGVYSYQLNPAIPTDVQLKNGFSLVATRTSALPEPYTFTLNQTGIITQIAP